MIQIPRPEDCALFLDLDGTVIEIASVPGGVVIPAELTSLLQRLSRGLNGALAVVSGRPISEIDRFLAPLRVAAAGVHGAELRTGAEEPVQGMAGPIDSCVLRAVKQLVGIADGVVVEPKRYSIAVHYRGAPSAGPAIATALRRILADGPDHLIVCSGRKVFEVVPRNVSKGTALVTLALMPRFQSRRPIMIGDDVSDETAFDAAVHLGGLGLKVAGEHFARGEADFDSPIAVLAWLTAIAERLET